jgi:hypothetical protein
MLTRSYLLPSKSIVRVENHDQARRHTHGGKGRKGATSCLSMALWALASGAIETCAAGPSISCKLISSTLPAVTVRHAEQAQTVAIVSAASVRWNAARAGPVLCNHANTLENQEILSMNRHRVINIVWVGYEH